MDATESIFQEVYVGLTNVDSPKAYKSDIPNKMNPIIMEYLVMIHMRSRSRLKYSDSQKTPT